jgi:hypothetical protein
MRELRVIHISGAALRNAGVTWFAHWVHLLPKLEHLTLHRCAIGSSESISILTQALTQLKLLKTLDFGQNIYGVSSADWVCQILLEAQALLSHEQHVKKCVPIGTKQVNISCLHQR